MSKLWTVNTIKQAMMDAGSHWFSPDTMVCFGTRVLPHVFQGVGGVYFVTEDEFGSSGTRRHCVRQFHPQTMQIATVDLARYATEQKALRRAEELAGDGAVVTKEVFVPVTEGEQFTADLLRHSADPALVAPEEVASLIHYAGEHRQLMEMFCSEPVPDDYDERVTLARHNIIASAHRLGCAGAIFSGDPRGSTVKLRFADGYTNDFGHTGYCVPGG